LNALPRDANSNLASWDFDTLTGASLYGVDWTGKQKMVLTLKAWLTKIGALEFDLVNDEFNG
jgi:hypothetical protein